MQEELKYKALAMLKCDASPKQVVSELGVPYPKVIQWRKELRDAEESGTVLKTLDVDKLIVERVAEETRRDLKEVLPTTGELLERQITETTKGLDGLKLLSTRLQTTSLNLASKILELSDEVESPREIGQLVDSLTKLQMAFFNKGGPTVQVMQQNNSMDSESVQKFKKFCKD